MARWTGKLNSAEGFVEWGYPSAIFRPPLRLDFATFSPLPGLLVPCNDHRLPPQASLDAWVDRRPLERLIPAFFLVRMGQRALMKYLAVASFVALAVEPAAAIAQAGGGAGGANWFLRSPDGSSQGPYGLSQLGEWSSAGYVSPGERAKGSCVQHERLF